MTIRRVIAAVACAFVLLASRAAAGDPTLSDREVKILEGRDSPTHLLTPSTATTDGGSSVRLPAGYFLSEELWDHLNLEVKRLQDAETRLRAENKSLRESDGPGWGWFIGLAVGIAGGSLGTWYLLDKYGD